MRNNKILIGVDPGTKTGFAVWDIETKSFVEINTLPIFLALERVKSIYALYSDELVVVVEDARKRKWFGDKSDQKQQGAGSVKRDCKIWEDFLNDLSSEKNSKLTYEMLHPVKGATKINKELFKKISGITV